MGFFCKAMTHEEYFQQHAGNGTYRSVNGTQRLEYHIHSVSTFSSMTECPEAMLYILWYTNWNLMASLFSHVGLHPHISGLVWGNMSTWSVMFFYRTIVNSIEFSPSLVKTVLLVRWRFVFLLPWHGNAITYTITSIAGPAWCSYIH